MRIPLVRAWIEPMRRRTDAVRLEHRHYRLARRCISLYAGPGEALRMHRFVAAVVVCLLFAASSRTPPEDALRATIDTMHAAVEAREMGPLSEGIAQDFIGPGGMDRT